MTPDPRLTELESRILALGYPAHAIERTTIEWHLRLAGSVEAAITAMGLNRITQKGAL